VVRERCKETQAAQRERYQELLGELRTIIPGVQVLFAFLLTAPFSARFHLLDGAGHTTYFVSVTATALATIVLMTPAALHRLAPRADRSVRIRVGVRLTIAGMVLLATAVATALFVVTRFVFESEVAGAVVASTVVLAALTMWFAFPLAMRRRSNAP
jgi:hypothetical protein